jgi:hypothetical protein
VPRNSTATAEPPKIGLERLEYYDTGGKEAKPRFPHMPNDVEDSGTDLRSDASGVEPKYFET